MCRPCGGAAAARWHPRYNTWLHEELEEVRPAPASCRISEAETMAAAGDSWGSDGSSQRLAEVLGVHIVIKTVARSLPPIA